LTGSWSSYSASDFVPFTAEVYFRLIERVNAADWPLHLLTLAAALALLPLLHRGHGRTAGLILAALWAWVGYAFLLREYASLNWVGRYFAWAFWLQAALLAGAGLSGRLGADERSNPTLVRRVGQGLYLAGVGYPAIAIATGAGWARAEVVGIHPDPTVMVALGLCLLGLRGGLFWAALIVPLGWCLVSGVTLWVLKAGWALALVGCGLMVPVAGLFRALAGRGHQGAPE
jgi:hypothetical protein